MGLYDRDYTQEKFSSGFSGGQMQLGFAKPTIGVIWLLALNCGIFLVQVFGADKFLLQWFSVVPDSLLHKLQLWRLVTYQFLHGGLGHIFFNMLGLFFLGPAIERHWGTVKFLIFYLGCGIAGGLLYMLLASAGLLSIGPMIGASGAVLGILAACAILFPHFVVILVVFPVPIRIAAIILIIFASITLLTGGPNQGGEVCHLGGMAAGAVYVFLQSWRTNLKLRVRAGQWERKMAKERALQNEVDRILKNVHEKGIQSLKYREKRVLKKATELQRRQNKREW